MYMLKFRVYIIYCLFIFWIIAVVVNSTERHLNPTTRLPTTLKHEDDPSSHYRVSLYPGGGEGMGERGGSNLGPVSGPPVTEHMQPDEHNANLTNGERGRKDDSSPGPILGPRPTGHMKPGEDDDGPKGETEGKNGSSPRPILGPRPTGHMKPGEGDDGPKGETGGKDDSSPGPILGPRPTGHMKPGEDDDGPKDETGGKDDSSPGPILGPRPTGHMKPGEDDDGPKSETGGKDGSSPGPILGPRPTGHMKPGEDDDGPKGEIGGKDGSSPMPILGPRPTGHMKPGEDDDGPKDETGEKGDSSPGPILGPRPTGHMKPGEGADGPKGETEGKYGSSPGPILGPRPTGHMKPGEGADGPKDETEGKDDVSHQISTRSGGHKPKPVMPTPPDKVSILPGKTDGVPGAACDGEIDCNGDCKGKARRNKCNVCVGGETGRLKDHGMDCNKDCGGEAYIDEECNMCIMGNTGRTANSIRDTCGQCKRQRGGRPSITIVPSKDCADVCNGNAFVDLCGDCVGGTTGEPIDKNNHRLNCKNQCNRDYQQNSCGECVPAAIKEQSDGRDCNGSCTRGRRRPTIHPECGVCYRRGELDTVFNECGVCVNEEDEDVKNRCYGCDDQPNSGKVRDACGVCDSKLDCTTIQSVQPNMLPNSGLQTITIRGDGFLDEIITQDGGSRGVGRPGSERRRRRNTPFDDISCKLALTTTANGVARETMWSVSGTPTKTEITCQSDGEPLGTGVYEVSVMKGSEEIRGSTSVLVTVYQPPAILSLTPTEFDVIKDQRGQEQRFTINVILEGNTNLYEFTNFVPKLIVQGERLNNVFDIGNDGKAILEGSVTSDAQMEFTFPFKTCTSKSFLVQPSLDGLTPLPGGNDDDGFLITIYTERPRPERIRFNDDGESCTVKFNQNVNTDNLDSCDNIFEQTGMLGFGAECEWISQKLLVVRLGDDANVNPGDSIQFRSDAFSGFGEEYSRESADAGNSTLLVESATNPKEPVAVVNVPSQISSCVDRVKVEGGKSRSGNRKGLKYVWSIRSKEVDTDSLQVVLNRYNNENEGKGVEEFTLTEPLQPSAMYELTLEVENSLGLTNSVTKMFEKLNDAIPMVTVEVKEGAETIAVSQELKLCATVEGYVKNCFELRNTEFEWTSNNPDVISEKTNSRCLRIPPYTLPGGEVIQFGVIAYREGERNNYASASINITTVNSDLTAKIAGGKKHTFNYSNVVELDGSKSTDPDEEPGQISYAWLCEMAADKLPCYDADDVLFPTTDESGSSKLTIMPGQMIPDSEYDFSLLIQKGIRFASTTVTVMCTEKEFIEIQLRVEKQGMGSNGDKKYDSDKNIDIIAKIKSKSNITEFKWETEVPDTEENEESYRFLNIDDDDVLRRPSQIKKVGRVYVAQLNLNPGVLSKSSTYLIKFTATNKDGITESNTIKIQTRKGIEGCEVATSGVYTPLSEIECVVSGCSADGPLTYQVLIGSTTADNIETTTAISQETTDSHVKAIAPPPREGESTVDLKIKVCVVGDCITLTRTEQVADDMRLSEEEKEEYIKVEVEDNIMKGDTTNAYLKLTMLAEYERSSSPDGSRRKRNTGDETRRMYGGLQTDILDLVLADGNIGKSDRQALLDQTKYLAFDSMNSTTKTKAVENTRKLLEEGEDWLETMDKDRGRNVLDGLADAAEGIEPRQSRDLVDEIREARRLTLAAISRGLSFEEEFKADTTDCHIKVKRSQLSENLKSHSGEDAVGIDFGDSMREQYGTDWECADDRTCSDVIVKLEQYKGVDYSSFDEVDARNVIANITSISVANPETGDDIEIANLTTPVTITIPLCREVPEGKRAVGKFMNRETLAWESTGVSTSFSDDNKNAILRSTHLTEFTVVTEDIDDSSVTQGLNGENGQNQDGDDGDDDGDDTDVQVAEEGESNTMIVIIVVVVIAVFILAIVVSAVAWAKVKKRKQVSPAPSKEKVSPE